ncbi:hypothetical protein QG516_06400 [Pedobacter gandavensis]|uniref:hypothetical protein n=1 Tax=Pedobacter gandavensis TaxID=2679963 RepID=UPI0024799654|nr:hypothetical protein [Pedobacter gandavensis]WGQ11284.1 hypothetical protein QG516_06400 [Pedobacter gandavensis]
MESKRRSFLRNVSLLAGTGFLSKPLSAVADLSKTVNTLSNSNTVTIFQSGNINGNISGNSQELGGLKEINRLMKGQEVSGLMVDAGCFLDNENSVELISQMNKAGYHAVNIGAAELKNGEEALAEMLPFLEFPLVNCNYSFNNAVLASKVRSHIIIQSGNLKVGITGVGKELPGVHFQNPYQALNKVAELLKFKAACDLVICLSALDADHKIYNNRALAEKSEGVDFIIGKNDKKVTTGAMTFQNSKKGEVVLSQVGYDGMILGKTSFSWDPIRKIKNELKHSYLVAGLPLNENSAQAHRILHEMRNAEMGYLS